MRYIVDVSRRFWRCYRFEVSTTIQSKSDKYTVYLLHGTARASSSYLLLREQLVMLANAWMFCFTLWSWTGSSHPWLLQYTVVHSKLAFIGRYERIFGYSSSVLLERPCLYSDRAWIGAVLTVVVYLGLNDSGWKRPCRPANVLVDLQRCSELVCERECSSYPFFGWTTFPTAIPPKWRPFQTMLSSQQVVTVWKSSWCKSRNILEMWNSDRWSRHQPGYSWRTSSFTQLCV